MRRRLKIILHNHDVINSIFGAVQIAERDDWLCLDRFSEKQRERLNGDERLGKRALSSSGMMLDFWTDSTTLAFDYQTFIASNKMFFYFDIYVNGELLFHEGKEEVYREEGHLSVCLKEGKKRVTVYFPCLFGKPNHIKTTASYLHNGADGSGSAIFDYKSFPAVLSYSKVGQSLAPCEIVGDKGSIIIERIGLYMGAYLVLNGKKISLSDEEPKDVLMSYEASAFADFIKGKSLERYEENSKLCEEVHECMDMIKVGM